MSKYLTRDPAKTKTKTKTYYLIIYCDRCNENSLHSLTPVSSLKIAEEFRLRCAELGIKYIKTIAFEVEE